jgi:serine/threonine protein phosphatase 1
MSLTYAIPDLHGRVDLLAAALERIEAHSTGESSTVVTLGDYVDRGPDSCRVIERLMSWRPDYLSIVSLKGNHEAMMWETCNNLAELSRWIHNGGDKTLASYGLNLRDVPPRVPLEHLQWIANLPLFHADQHRVFVHAAVDPMLSLGQQNVQTLLWGRYPKDSSVGHANRHVVHGHHAQIDAPIVTKGRTNLDGMAWKTGRLIVGVFEDDRPGGASEFLEILGSADR